MFVSTTTTFTFFRFQLCCAGLQSYWLRRSSAASTLCSLCTQEKPRNVFMWSQSAYLLDDSGAFMPSVHFASSWRGLLSNFGVDSSVPAEHALSGRRATSSALPYIRLRGRALCERLPVPLGRLLVPTRVCYSLVSSCASNALSSALETGWFLRALRVCHCRKTPPS